MGCRVYQWPADVYDGTGPCTSCKQPAWEHDFEQRLPGPQGVFRWPSYTVTCWQADGVITATRAHQLANPTTSP